LKNEQLKMNTLMDTIIAPVNLKKLKDRLPKKKSRKRASSCSRIIQEINLK